MAFCRLYARGRLTHLAEARVGILDDAIGLQYADGGWPEREMALNRLIHILKWKKEVHLHHAFSLLKETKFAKHSWKFRSYIGYYLLN